MYGTNWRIRRASDRIHHAAAASGSISGHSSAAERRSTAPTGDDVTNNSSSSPTARADAEDKAVLDAMYNAYYFKDRDDRTAVARGGGGGASAMAPPAPMLDGRHRVVGSATANTDDNYSPPNAFGRRSARERGLLTSPTAHPYLMAPVAVGCQRRALAHNVTSTVVTSGLERMAECSDDVTAVGDQPSGPDPCAAPMGEGPTAPVKPPRPPTAGRSTLGRPSAAVIIPPSDPAVGTLLVAHSNDSRPVPIIIPVTSLLTRRDESDPKGSQQEQQRQRPMTAPSPATASPSDVAPLHLPAAPASAAKGLWKGLYDTTPYDTYAPTVMRSAGNDGRLTVAAADDAARIVNTLGTVSVDLTTYRHTTFYSPSAAPAAPLSSFYQKGRSILLDAMAFARTPMGDGEDGLGGASGYSEAARGESDDGAAATDCAALGDDSTPALPKEVAELLAFEAMQHRAAIAEEARLCWAKDYSMLELMARHVIVGEACDVFEGCYFKEWALLSTEAAEERARLALEARTYRLVDAMVAMREASSSTAKSGSIGIADLEIAPEERALLLPILDTILEPFGRGALVMEEEVARHAVGAAAAQRLVSAADALFGPLFPSNHSKYLAAYNAWAASIATRSSADGVGVRGRPHSSSSSSLLSPSPTANQMLMALNRNAILGKIEALNAQQQHERHKEQGQSLPTAEEEIGDYNNGGDYIIDVAALRRTGALDLLDMDDLRAMLAATERRAATGRPLTRQRAPKEDAFDPSPASRGTYGAAEVNERDGQLSPSNCKNDKAPSTVHSVSRDGENGMGEMEEVTAEILPATARPSVVDGEGAEGGGGQHSRFGHEGYASPLNTTAEEGEPCYPSGEAAEPSPQDGGAQNASREEVGEEDEPSAPAQSSSLANDDPMLDGEMGRGATADPDVEPAPLPPRGPSATSEGVDDFPPSPTSPSDPDLEEESTATQRRRRASYQQHEGTSDVVAASAAAATVVVGDGAATVVEGPGNARHDDHSRGDDDGGAYFDDEDGDEVSGAIGDGSAGGRPRRGDGNDGEGGAPPLISDSPTNSPTNNSGGKKKGPSRGATSGTQRSYLRRTVKVSLDGTPIPLGSQPVVARRRRPLSATAKGQQTDPWPLHSFGDRPAAEQEAWYCYVAGHTTNSDGSPKRCATAVLSATAGGRTEGSTAPMRQSSTSTCAVGTQSVGPPSRGSSQSASGNLKSAVAFAAAPPRLAAASAASHPPPNNAGRGRKASLSSALRNDDVNGNVAAPSLYEAALLRQHYHRVAAMEALEDRNRLSIVLMEASHGEVLRHWCAGQCRCKVCIAAFAPLALRPTSSRGNSPVVAGRGGGMGGESSPLCSDPSEVPCVLRRLDSMRF